MSDTPNPPNLPSMIARFGMTYDLVLEAARRDFEDLIKAPRRPDLDAWARLGPGGRAYYVRQVLDRQGIPWRWFAAAVASSEVHRAAVLFTNDGDHPYPSAWDLPAGSLVWLEGPQGPFEVRDVTIGTDGSPQVNFTEGGYLRPWPDLVEAVWAPRRGPIPTLPGPVAPTRGPTGPRDELTAAPDQATEGADEPPSSGPPGLGGPIFTRLDAPAWRSVAEGMEAWARECAQPRPFTVDLVTHGPDGETRTSYRVEVLGSRPADEPTEGADAPDEPRPGCCGKPGDCDAPFGCPAEPSEDLDAALDASDRAAYLQTLDELARLAGAPEWEYPGQVLRDVLGLLAEAWWAGWKDGRASRHDDGGGPPMDQAEAWIASRLQAAELSPALAGIARSWLESVRRKGTRPEPGQPPADVHVERSRLDVPPVVSELLAELDKHPRRGFTPEHDDQHVRGELADAAALLAAPRPTAGPSWAWSLRERHARRDQLLTAAALLVREIQRLDRARVRGAAEGYDPHVAGYLSSGDRLAQQARALTEIANLAGAKGYDHPLEVVTEVQELIADLWRAARHVVPDRGGLRSWVQARMRRAGATQELARLLADEIADLWEARGK